MDVKIKLIGDGRMPTKGTEDAACYDCYARCDCAVTNHTMIIPLGFAIEIPKGYHAKIFPRSSTGLKTNVRMANSVGIIDSDYRGEVGFIAEAKYNGYNFIHKGERIAQMLIEKNVDVEFVQVEELSDTERGEGGFGSSGRF